MSGVNGINSRELVMQGFTDPKSVETTKTEATKTLTVEERYAADSMARKATIATILSTCKNGNCQAPSLPLGNPIKSDANSVEDKGDKKSVPDKIKKEESKAGTTIRVGISDDVNEKGSADGDKEVAKFREMIEEKVKGKEHFENEDTLGNKLADYVTSDFVEKAKEEGWDDEKILTEAMSKQQRFENIGDALNETEYAKWDASEIKEMVEEEVEGNSLYTGLDSLGNTLTDYATQDFVDKANSNQWDDGQILSELQAKQVKFEGMDDGFAQDALASAGDFDEFES